MLCGSIEFKHRPMRERDRTPNRVGMREGRINISKEKREIMLLADLQSQPHLRPEWKTKTKVTRSNVATDYSDLLSSLSVRPQVRIMSVDSESRFGEKRWIHLWRWWGVLVSGSREVCITTWTDVDGCHQEFSNPSRPGMGARYTPCCSWSMWQRYLASL